MVQYQEFQHQIVGHWNSATLRVQYLSSATFNYAAVSSATSNGATLTDLTLTVQHKTVLH